MGNPFTLTFGKKPAEYIIRREHINEIKGAFLNTPSRCQTYLIQGVRGSGKTVLMTTLSIEIAEEKDWICVDLNSSLNLLEDLSYRLADACESAAGLIDRGLDISVAGFGIGIGSREARDNVSRCEHYLKQLSAQGKKLLITIDEVSNTESMRQFAGQFQIWIRKDFPVFLLMTGLYENIYAIQNSPQLTFLLRSPKVTLGPLSLSLITRQYESALNISTEKAIPLARLTKGYAFAFQALGMLYYDYNVQDNDASIQREPDNAAILRNLDSCLDEYVYSKIWNSLSPLDQKVILQLSDEAPSRVKDVCDAVGMNSSNFSKYRERLIKKGLITAQQHGYLEPALPRFCVICRLYQALI
ncbi:MAG: ATP-binding protein [Eubacteriales bacterium]|nr:ATP-binding protein [Eubacteriales bacterium]